MNWKFGAHIAESKQHILQDRAIYKGVNIRRETVTRINKHGLSAGKSKTYYYILTEPGEYETVEECMKAVDSLNIDRMLTEIDNEKPNRKADRNLSLLQ